jgi:hypothetical protein
VNTQLAKLIEEAFDVLPEQWASPIAIDEYAAGPAFIAYAPGFVPDAERFSIYLPSPGLMPFRKTVFDSLMQYAPEPDPELTVCKDAHKRLRTKDNCKARALMQGEYEMDIELAYPLYKLMRFYKPDRFALQGNAVYAWDGERIVFVGSARSRINNCMEERNE